MNMTNIEVVVAAIIINSANEVLLCKSHKWDDKYVIPGGHVKFGETLEQALIREVKEETGLEVFDLSLAGVKENVLKDTHGKKRHFIVFDFECKTHMTDVVLNNEAESYLWIREANMFSLPLDDYTRAFFSARANQSVLSKMILYNV